VLKTSLLSFSALSALIGTTAIADKAPVKNSETIVVTGSRIANASIKGLEIEPLRLPQNVRVLDDSVINDAGFTKLGDLYDLAGAMSRQNSFGGAWDAYAIRGFSGDINQGPDLLINRFTANRGFNARRDIATIEQFEILKGPASALSGKGEPGGSINILTKAPNGKRHFSVDVSAGSFDTIRGAFDMGMPVSDKVDTRLVVAIERSDGYRDFTPSDRILFAPSLALNPTDDLRILYQGEYNRVNFTHDRGIAAINGNSLAIPITRFLGEPNDGQITQDIWQHQLSLTKDIAEGIAFETGIQYRDGSMVGQSTHNTATIIDGMMRRQLRIHDYAWDDLSGRAELSFLKTFGTIKHNARIGADAYQYNQYRKFWRFRPSAANPYAINVFNPIYNQAKPIATLNTDNHEDLKGKGFYVQDLISIGDNWSLLLGVRHDKVDQKVINLTNNSFTTQEVSETSPRAAITYKFNDDFSIYAGYGKSFRFNQGTDKANKAFAPELGSSFEAGMKYAILGNKLRGTISYFDIIKENILSTDPTDSAYQLALGEAQSKGIEVESNYYFSRKHYVTMVYAYIDSEITKDTTPALIGTRLSNIPTHSGAIFYNYTPKTSGFSYNIGLNYIGDRAGDPYGSSFELPSYVTLNAGIGYKLNENADFSLELKNLTDEKYIENSYDSAWLTPGTPRSVTFRLRYKL